MFAGTMKGLSGLQPGAAYFSNSLGELVGGDVWYGNGAASMAEETSFSYYEYDSNTLVDCSNSMIGVALSDSVLLLKVQ